MSVKNRLGFGMMRLPVHNGDPTDFDYEQINRMVDEFIGAGFTYFDTSYVYHNGKSEEATRKALVERHPRDSFTVATKFPTFDMKHEEEIEPLFAQQLKNLGVDYIDYYLLHNIQTVLYDGIDGNGGIIKTCHLFEHAKKWKEEGKIKHLGFSFHSSAKVLDRILTEHPEAEFVQIALNYYDWESGFVQARSRGAFAGQGCRCLHVVLGTAVYHGLGWHFSCIVRYVYLGTGTGECGSVS